MPDDPQTEQLEALSLTNQYKRRRVTLHRKGDRYYETERHVIAHYADDVVVDFKSLRKDDAGVDFEKLREEGRVEKQIMDALHYNADDIALDVESVEGDFLSATAPPDVDRASPEQLSLSQADIIERAKELEADDEAFSAVSLLITTFDELFRGGHFPLCNSILHRVDPMQCSTDMLSWIIKATRPAQSKLALRAKFVQRAKQVMQDRGDLRQDSFDRLE